MLLLTDIKNILLCATLLALSCIYSTVSKNLDIHLPLTPQLGSDPFKSAAGEPTSPAHNVLTFGGSWQKQLQHKNLG